MTAFYVKSGSGALEMQNRTWSTGDRMVTAFADASSNYATARKWVWECTTGGDSTGTPTWPSSVTQDVTTVTQNGVVWTARRPGYSSGTTANWTFATIYLIYGMSATGSKDTVYVSNNHAESWSAAHTITGTSDIVVQCVDDGAAPPTSVANTATVTTTGNSNLTIGGNSVNYTSYFNGITFQSGSGASGTASISTSGQFQNCNFKILTTGASSTISGSVSVFINCGFLFSAAGQTIAGNPICKYSGGSVLAGGTSPTTLFNTSNNNNCIYGQYALLVENFDLSDASSSINLCNLGATPTGAYFRNIKLPSSWSGSLNSATPGWQSAVTMANVDASGTNYVVQSKDTYGSLVQETTITRTGGANNGTTGISWKVVTTSGAGLFPRNYSQTPEIVKWVGTTGSPVTATVEIVSSAALNNDEIWLEVSYLSASGAPLGTLVTNAKASVLASAAAQTSSTATWNSSPATPAYQKLSVTFTPQLKGFIHAVVKVCKASKTVYIDPMITLS